jgi:predicted aminopeptidase
VTGHLELMRQREDVTEILSSGSASPELARELELSLELREFAIEKLNLPDNASYTRYVATGREAVSWNVAAAPELSLSPRRWCFLVAGCVPYLGYFKRQAAEEHAARLAGAGFDTAVSPVLAYSTLGWFDDPLLDTMFRYSDEQLAGFIFHELAHQQLYVRGDTAFNESYASFIENTGVRLWLESSGRESQLPGWQKLREAGLQFNALLQKTVAELEAVYSSGQAEENRRQAKAVILKNLELQYQALVDSQCQGRSYFAPLFARDLNNASLALVNSYHGGNCAFEALYREADEDIVRFQQLATARAALDNSQRHSWLKQPCEIIASGSDL